MKSKEELLQIYEERLVPSIGELEKDRKRTLLRLVLAFLLLPGLAYFAINGLWWGTGILAVLVLVLCIMAIQPYERYKRRFKDTIVRGIVRAINPDFAYDADNCIGEDDYIDSEIFPQDYDSYDGDDYVAGVIDKTPFVFSELHTQEVEVYYDSDGDSHERWKDIFHGLFFVATFNKELTGRTFVVPDRKNIFGRERKSLGGGVNLVKLENPEFERIFSVYADSQQEARYIMTPVMMEAVVRIYRQIHKRIDISFIGDNVYCAIFTNRATFEPKLHRKVRFRDVEEMFLLFGLIEVIIQEMNLNLRIWTKE